MNTSGSSHISNACSQAATAPCSIREQLQGAQRRHHCRQEQRANFAPYLDGGVKKKRKRGGHFHALPPPKRAKRTAWTAKFVGLESKSRSKVPCSVDEKEMLVSAGLGERDNLHCRCRWFSTGVQKNFDCRFP